MAVRISRVFTRESGTTTPSAHPNLVAGTPTTTMDVVIETEAQNRVAADIYRLFIQALDLTTGNNVGGLSKPGLVETFALSWTTTPEGFERSQAYPLIVPGGLTDHLLKYFVALVTVTTPVEVATAESELFILA